MLPHMRTNMFATGQQSEPVQAVSIRKITTGNVITQFRYAALSQEI
jgi:hypothetical protein